jgi:hypothetical protein
MYELATSRILLKLKISRNADVLKRSTFFCATFSVFALFYFGPYFLQIKGRT